MIYGRCKYFRAPKTTSFDITIIPRFQIMLSFFFNRGSGIPIFSTENIVWKNKYHTGKIN